MAKYTGPKLRLSRREGIDLLLKSNVRSFDSKCRKKKAPGQFGDRAGRVTDYRLQLRMKQAIKRYYGMLERQFSHFYQRAERMKGSTAYNLLKLLETRLDNIVYRMGFASTRAEARQLVNHRSILVNGKIVNIPSALVDEGDVISVKEKSKKQARISSSLQLAEQRQLPDWLEVDAKELKGTFKRFPDINELQALLPEFQIHMVIELYSK
jgi:small subunit ribosomal protein S4